MEEGAVGLRQVPRATSRRENTFTARICFTETPFILKLNLKFSGSEVLLDSESNVGFGSTKQPQLVGKAE
jgi:hypothetical protein